ncbi:DUF4238 domain-containing protein [Arthrobacter alpinus]|nr:DUF4238 domain-containing protein [Arthrobacter alpinus]
MAKDHFIPAALIGRFSEDENVSPRKRRVRVLRSNGTTAISRAERIGYGNRLYDVDNEMFPTRGSSAVDDTWSTYEGNLSAALDNLIAGNVSASEWIDTLVPFVAATFARDRGYKSRVEHRLSTAAMPIHSSEDDEIHSYILDDTNINLNRVLEMDRHAAKALASEWTVYETDGDIVLPDVGYGFELVGENPDILALILPIGRRHVLQLIPTASRSILSIRDNVWIPNIEYAPYVSTAEKLNVELAKAAQDFVAGTEAAVGRLTVQNLGVFNWHSLEELVAIWPFRVDTRKLMGLHKVVSALVSGEINSPSKVILSPYHAISETEPSAAVIFARKDIRADNFLTMDGTGLVLAVN